MRPVDSLFDKLRLPNFPLRWITQISTRYVEGFYNSRDVQIEYTDREWRRSTRNRKSQFVDNVETNGVTQL